MTGPIPTRMSRRASGGRPRSLRLRWRGLRGGRRWGPRLKGREGQDRGRGAPCRSISARILKTRRGGSGWCDPLRLLRTLYLIILYFYHESFHVCYLLDVCVCFLSSLRSQGDYMSTWIARHGVGCPKKRQSMLTLRSSPLLPFFRHAHRLPILSSGPQRLRNPPVARHLHHLRTSPSSVCGPFRAFSLSTRVGYASSKPPSAPTEEKPEVSNKLDASDIAKDDGGTLHENIYTIPNLLTVSRILACPILGYAILHDNFYLSTSLLVYASLSDWVCSSSSPRSLAEDSVTLP